VVEICDVAARDGLQSAEVVWPTEDKLELVRRLVAAGARRLEVASFVNPERVPAMADAEAVCAGLPRVEGVRYVGLVLNERGMDRAAAAAGLHEVNVGVACTDSFAARNQGTTTAGSIEIDERFSSIWISSKPASACPKILEACWEAATSQTIVCMPCAAARIPRATATVDLPTPPLPVTKTSRLSKSSATRSLNQGREGASGSPASSVAISPDGRKRSWACE